MRANGVRRVVTTLLGVLFLLAGTGCDQSAGQSTLIIWHPWGGAELQALKEAIHGFEKLHPKVEILALQVPSDALQDKYLRSSAANGGPDLLIGPVDWIGKFAQSQVISPLDTEIATASLRRYLPTALAPLRYHHHLYALPESMETLALYYNKSLLSGKPPSTLQSLFITANSPDYWHGEYLLAYNTQFFFSAGYLFGMGGRLFSPSGAVSLVTPAAIRWLNLLHDLKTDPKMAAKSDYGRADALFRDGKAAMTINGPWALDDYRKALGKNLGVAMLPKVSNTQPALPFVGVKCFMFNPNSTPVARSRAIAFASYMTSPKIASMMERKAGHIPAVRGVKIPAGDPLQAFVEQARYGTPLPSDPAMKEVWAPMDEAIEKVMTDVASPDAAMAKAQRIIAAKIQAVREQ